MSWDEIESEPTVEEPSGGLIQDLLSDPLGVVRRRRLPMAICGVVGVLASIVASVFWQPVYFAAATITVTDQQISSEFVRPTVVTDTIANINATLGNVLSSENLSKLIDTHDLFSDRADSVTRADLVREIQSRVGANPVTARAARNTDAMIYEISYSSPNAEEAADVANAVATLFVEESIRQRSGQARKATVFLRKEAERNEAELREQSQRVSEFRRAHRGELPEELQTTVRKLDVMALRRESLVQQISAKEDRIIALSAGGTGATEGELLLADLRRQLANQMAVHTDEHPNVIALRERIERFKEGGGAVAPGADRLVDVERRDIQRMHEEIGRIDAEIAELNQRVDNTPRVAEELSALEKKELVLSDDYLAAARKVEEAELAESLETAQQGGQVSLLDAATTPRAPDKSRWMIALMGLALSAVGALGVAALLELVDPVLLGSRQIEKLSDRPVLGSLPDIA